MIQKTGGIVLRTIKYGESSLIVTMFTCVYGVQTYMLQGIRSPKSKLNRAGLLQPGTILDLVVFHHTEKNLQRIKEFQTGYFYKSIQEEIIKNSILLFSVELLLRLLPTEAPLEVLYNFTCGYFEALDIAKYNEIGNYPLYFIVNCSRILGYELYGTFSDKTPHLNLLEGGFSTQTPSMINTVTDDEAKALDAILKVQNIIDLHAIPLNGAMRHNLIDWYIMFLQRHTQHMGSIKSLDVLKAILR